VKGRKDGGWGVGSPRPWVSGLKVLFKTLTDFKRDTVLSEFNTMFL
jgi:hypothetical protein